MCRDKHLKHYSTLQKCYRSIESMIIKKLNEIIKIDNDDDDNDDVMRKQLGCARKISKLNTYAINSSL